MSVFPSQKEKTPPFCRPSTVHNTLTTSAIDRAFLPPAAHKRCDMHRERASSKRTRIIKEEEEIEEEGGMRNVNNAKTENTNERYGPDTWEKTSSDMEEVRVWVQNAEVKVCVCVEKNRKYAPLKFELGQLVLAFESYAWNEGGLEVGLRLGACESSAQCDLSLRRLRS
jgi:hypothetical protein